MYELRRNRHGPGTDDIEPGLLQFAHTIWAGQYAPMHGMHMCWNEWERCGLITVYREGRYQAELIRIGANHDIREHAHPHVDTIEIVVGGSGCAWIDGEQVAICRSNEEIARKRDVGRYVVIPAGVYHGGFTSSYHGMFLSCQYWRDSDPRSIVDDWIEWPHAPRLKHEHALAHE